MKIKTTATFAFLSFLISSLQAQVWFPEGVYNNGIPVQMTADNHLTVISKAGSDNTNSYWQVSVNEGKMWYRLPLLKLDKPAEITRIIRFQGMIYVAGSFLFDNGNHSSLVRFNGVTWQGTGLIQKQGGLQATVNALEVLDGDLALGGNFYTIGKDTLPYLARFNGIRFSDFFESCRDCAPDNAVTDIVANDSVLAVSGYFTVIGKHKSKYLFRLYKGILADTFISSSVILDRMALQGKIIFGTGGQLKNKRIYKIAASIEDITSDIDTVYQAGKMVIWDNTPVLCGVFQHQNQTGIRNGILKLDSGKWKDISSNYKNASLIASARGILFAAGNPPTQLSTWNPNRQVVRFYPGLALVRASVFLDSNNNCIREPGERPLPKQYIKLPFLNRGVFTNEHGIAEFLVPNSVQATFRFVVKPFRNLVRSNCADTAVSKTFYPGIFTDSIQFPLKRMPNINDIRVLLSSPRGTQVTRNKKVAYYLVYENVGSNPISGTIRLRTSKLFTKENTIPAFKTKVNDSTCQWEFSNLMPGERQVIIYTAYPEDARFDENFTFDAAAFSTIAGGNNAYAGDDADSIPQQANQGISAFRKDVFPTPATGDSVTYLPASESDLRYNIAFNNFTSDTVFYAVVIDTLDLNLDMSYIEETGSNKAYFTEVQTDPNNQYKGILIWHFPNIRLAPNPGMDYENTESGAYIGFKVVTKPLSQGYYIRNTASVFFDNTFAGNTNSVYCTLAITSVDEINQPEDGLNVFPNPFEDHIILQYDLKADDRVEVYDARGVLVIANDIKLPCSEAEIELRDLPAGLYTLRLQASGRTIVRKLVRQ